MTTQLLIIAHAPLAQALRVCALHVYPEQAQAVMALDVDAHTPPEQTLAQARQLLAQVNGADAQPELLVLTDICGATPANVAQKLIAGRKAQLIAGVNLPMLFKTVGRLDEPLDALVLRALSGGTQGVMPIEPPVPSATPGP